MITFDNGGRLVEDVSELPALTNAKRLYLDTETSSGDPRLNSLNPWHHCSVAGIALTADDVRGAWYVPRHLIREDWLSDVLCTCESWVNHNVKYDAHVVSNDLDVTPTQCRLVDTVTQAKLVNSDMLNYSLDNCAKRFLKCADDGKYSARLAPYLVKNKDYGRVPHDVMAEYGCQDVLVNRRLDRYILHNLPEQCSGVSDTEIRLTRVLWEMERNGLRVDPTRLMIKEMQVLNRMQQIDDELASLVGRSFRPDTNADCYDVLCNQYGLPVMGLTDAGEPSFDKHAMAQYEVHPYAPHDVVRLIMEYRHINTLRNLFITKFQEHHVDGVIHTSYNQCIRTGRLSCRDPNMQQNSKEAKELVIPGDGYSFISCDASQIEFRVIVHYIRDRDCIEAYQNDPDTDFHQWVADMTGMKRKPAKNVNFMMGYGGGKEKCVSMLSVNGDVVGHLKAEVDEMIAAGRIPAERAMQAFNVLCRRKAEEVYSTYHTTLPGLKRTSYRACQALKEKGYVYNVHGRHRHLPHDKAHKAFNTLCQGEAADLIKERTVALAEVLKAEAPYVELLGNVHDELLMRAPTELITEELKRRIVEVLESPAVPLRVPLRFTIGVDSTDWRRAGDIATVLPRAPGSTPVTGVD